MISLLLLFAVTAIVQGQVFDIPRSVPLSDDLPLLPTLTKRRQWDEPCSEVAELWAAQKAQAATAATPVPIRVPAELAFKCLQTVPVDVEGDVKEIQELKEYLQWQSTLAYLKTGVEGQLEPVDIMGTLDEISAAVQNGTFTSDYEVQFAIRALLDSAGDFHLQFFTDLTTIFEFARIGASLVSLSEDGLSLPKIYFQSDILLQKNSRFIPSPVVSINGRNASDYLEAFSSGTKYHDADTRYNTIFSNPALSALGTDPGGLFLTHYVYDGPNTAFTFANGSTRTIDNLAFIAARYDFSTVKDGSSFFEAFCQGPQEPTESAAAVVPSATVTPTSVSTPTPKPAPRLAGYPQPIFVQSSRKFSGYYFNESDFKDVAVLAVPAFDPTSADSELGPTEGGVVETQQLLRSFFADAVKQGKKKLVIDLRGNGGGTIDMGFEFFKQLFPTVEPYGAARYRAHEAFHYYSAIVADLAIEGTDVDGVTSDEWDDADYGISSTFLWSNILDVNREHYKSYADYYGPDIIHNDTFGSIRRYNFSNNAGGHTLSVSLTGYNEQPTPSQPFQAENIVIIQDGFCGSTCAIFSELMREQGKVQTIAIGGRPKNEPMQGVGGSKGSQKLDLDALWTFAQRTLETSKALDGEWVATKLNDTTAVGRIYNAEQIYKRTTHVPGSSLLGAINSLNNLRDGDSTETPLEFVYEAADCRLFYTRETLSDPAALWKQAIEAKWGNGSCVPGSTGHATAIGVLNNDTFEGQRKSSPSTQTPIETKGAASGTSVSLLTTLFGAALAAAIVL